MWRPVNFPLDPTLAERFCLVVRGVIHTVGEKLHRDPAKIPFILLVQARLHRTIARFNALFHRYKAGTLRPPRRRPPRPELPPTARGAEIPPDEPPRPRRENLPAGLAMRRLVPEVGMFGAQLEDMLRHDKEMAAFLEAAPQAKRLIRPLLRLLHVTDPPPTIRLPPRAPRPASASRPPRERKPRPPSRARELRTLFPGYGLTVKNCR